eukprot:983122-Ditylum_brightwellii.AAC.1
MASNTLLWRYVDPLLSPFALMKYYLVVFNDGRIKRSKENPPPSTTEIFSCWVNRMSMQNSSSMAMCRGLRRWICRNQQRTGLGNEDNTMYGK